MSGADAFERVVEHERAAHRRRHVRRARRALRLHTWVFLAVNLAFIAAWLVERVAFDPAHPAWWLPATAGWGVGLAIHAALVHRPWRRRQR